MIDDARPKALEADAALVKALRGRQGRLTLADAVAASGLAFDAAEAALERLLERYRSHLAVTESGELLYAFDPSFRRRDQPTLKERAAAVGRALVRVGVVVFKVLIVVTLVAYLIAFILLLLGLAFGGGQRDDRRDHGRGWGHGGGGGMGGWVWLLWPGWGWGGPRDPWGRAPPSRQRGREAPRKRVVDTVFDFVFGPARPAADPLEDERELLAYVREHRGRIVATDLVKLFGWSYRRADEEATRLLAHYGGEPEVTEGGVIVYAFPSLLKSAGDAAAGRWRAYWERRETRPPLTGNRAGADVLVGGFALFNLLVSMRAADWAGRAYGLTGTGWEIGLTWFPLGFFSLFLAIPIGRAIARRLGDRGRARRDRRRQVVRQLLETRGGPIDDAPDLKRLALDFEGEPDLDAHNRVVWRFARVGEELAELERLLPGIDVAAERALGPVIFDSDEGPDTSGGDGEAPPSRRRALPH